MFTGIIRKTGKISKIEKRKGLIVLTVAAKLTNKKPGDSIAVDGCCLTITSCTKFLFKTDVMPETIGKTIIGKYKKGTVVNLENPLRIGNSLDGHFVQGHIDFTGKILDVSSESDSKTISVSNPASMGKYLAMKGSVTLNGVSLTISRLREGSFSVSLIPKTLKTTNLGNLKKGRYVNVEIDLIARYLESLIKK